MIFTDKVNLSRVS